MTPVPDFQALFESMPTLALVLKPDLTIVAVSDAYLRATMTVREKILGRGLFDVFPDNPEDPTATGVRNLRASLQRVLANRAPDVMAIQKYDIRRPESEGGAFEVRYWSPTNFPVFGADQEIAYIIHRVEDVTEIALRKQELQNTRTSLEKIMNAIADPIFVKNRRHEWVRLNDAFCQFIGHPREELIGRSDDDFFPKEEADAFRERDEAVFRSGRENSTEESFTDGQGIPHQIHTRKTLYTSAEGDVFIVGVIRDITERKRMEEELRALNATLERRVAERSAMAERRAEELARSNAELERFAYVASHDLQEPLRMVASYVQLLDRRYSEKLDADAGDFIHFAVDGVNRMKNLINGLLDYSRIGKNGQSPQRTDANAVLTHVLANLRIALEEKGADVTIAGPLPVVLSHPVQLAEVFQNLISNAVKFCGEHPPAIEISAELVDNRWLFRVRDNGIGIEPKHSARIFDLFQRLHPPDRYPGTGLGLAICKKIIEQQGGRIGVESQPGEGSTFFFSLAPG